MKVLMLNGSPHIHGSTAAALAEIGSVLSSEGVDFEIFQLGSDPVRDCIGCRACSQKGACVFPDNGVNEFIQTAKGCSGFVFGTPVYYAHPSGQVLSFLDRVFFSAPKDVFAHKPGFALAVARRAGTTASLDAITKHFSISQMPIISSTYWNMVHGMTADDVPFDKEGMQTMRNAARNLVWLMRCIAISKEHGLPLPVAEQGNMTNFIR